MNRYFNTLPVWITSIDSKPILLERVPGYDWATVGTDNDAAEDDLQEFLSKCPTVLPLAEFNSIYSDAVCIGREVSTAAGNIDLLYLSQQGRIIIGETKLYKNPESRREVVAQILDYASEVSKWKFEHINELAKSYFKKHYSEEPWLGLGSYVNSTNLLIDPEKSDEEPNQTNSAIDEDDYADIVNRSLHMGEILALVIVDRVRERTDSLVQYANRLPGLALELGLVELAVYRHPEQSSPMIIVPNIVQKTTIIERNIVQIEIEPEEIKHSVSITVQKEAPDIINKGRKPLLQSTEYFMKEVSINNTLEVTVCVQEILETFRSIADNSNGLYEINFVSTTCNIYWRQTTDKKVRILTITTDGRFRILTVYLRSKGLSEALNKMVELVSPFISMSTESVGNVNITSKNKDELIRLSIRIAEELEPLLSDK